MRTNGEPWWEFGKHATLEAVWDVGEERQCGEVQEDEEDVVGCIEEPTDRTWAEG